MRCISVTVRGSLYGLRLDEVQEVIGPRPVTRVFHAPLVLAGVASLRGEVLPIVELGVLLGGEPAEPEKDARIVVVREPAGARRRAGLRVDALGPLRELAAGGLQAPPATASARARELVVGIVPTPPPCALLSVSAILAVPELAELAGASEATP
jgi:purine-binding chemotaxis protein CheW